MITTKTKPGTITTLTAREVIRYMRDHQDFGVHGGNGGGISLWNLQQAADPIAGYHSRQAVQQALHSIAGRLGRWLPGFASWDYRYSTSYERLAEVAARYERWRHYCREIWPQWEDTGRKVSYCDESQKEQRSKRTGETRMVTTEYHWCPD